MLRCLRRDGGGGAITHAQACVTARRRRHAQGAVMLVAALLTIFAFSDAAFAEVDWHDQGNIMSATVASYSYPDGRPYALAEFLGYDWGSLSSSVRNSITSASNGDNPFNSALTHVKNVQYETNGTLNWPIISIWSTIFGLGDMWDIEMSNTLYNQAREHMKRYIYPNDGGVSSSGVTYELDGIVGLAWTGTSTTTSVVGRKFIRSVDPSFMTQYLSLIQEYRYALVFSREGYTHDGTTVISAGNSIILSKSPIQYQITQGTNPYGLQEYNITFTSNDVYQLSGIVSSSESEYDGLVHGMAYMPFNCTHFNSFTYNSYAIGLFIYSGEAIGNPYQPEPNPPSTQPTLQTPTAPTLPTTNAPTTPDSTPNNYMTIVNNNYPQPTYNQQPTGTSQDYTPWLDEIVILLRSINDYIYMGFDDLSTWFSVVDADMRTGIDNVLARLSSLKTGVHADLVWLSNNLEDWISDAALYLATYLHDCELYLGEIVGEYSDQIASVVSWLKRIYSRLGGNGAGKPSVTTDEPGFFDWLIDLLTGFLNDLLSNLPEWLQRLIGGFQDLSEHFPFSIPWDIAAMLQLLYHEPVTPVFDLPMPTITINGARSVNVHIDLTSWNGVAAIVREMVFIIFAVSLALNTKKLLSNLDM